MVWRLISLNTVCKGKVTDANGKPLAAVSVMVKGSNRGTTTNAEGLFQLKLSPADKVLVFTFAGMNTKEVNVTGKTIINVTMMEKVAAMTDVVVTGIVNRNTAAPGHP